MGRFGIAAIAELNSLTNGLRSGLRLPRLPRLTLLADRLLLRTDAARAGWS